MVTEAKRWWKLAQGHKAGKPYAAIQSYVYQTPWQAFLAAALFASRIHINPKLKLLNVKFVFLVPITTISN